MNRYATQQDADTFNPLLAINGRKITPGLDYIFDGPTKFDATKRIWVTKAADYFSNLRDGSCVWFLASALIKFQAVILTNESATVSKLKWPQLDTLYFGIIPDAQLNMVRGPQSYVNIPFKVNGVKNPRFLFRSAQFPMWSEDEPFQRDLAPIHIDSDTYFDFSGHAYWLVSPDGGDIQADGIAGGGGTFTLLRALADNQHGYCAGKIENVYAHDADGEPAYICTTDAGYYTALKDFKINNFLAVRNGSEFQIQHMQGGVDIGKVYIHNANFNYPKHHRNWQDAATQFVVDCGKNHIQSLFISDFGSNGIVFHGAAPYTGPDGKPNFTLQPGDELVIDRAYVYGGHLALYVNKAASYGVTWRIKELYIGGMHDEYATITGSAKVDYYLEHAGTDKVIIEKLIHDGSRARLAKDPAKFQVQSIELISQFPRPKYKWNHKKWMNWSEFVADYHPAVNGKRMVFSAGQYITDREHGFPAVFTKVRKDHISTPIRPKNDSENFEVITWDKKGIASDEPGHNPSDAQRPHPGDNFTHAIDSPMKDYFWITEKPKVEEVLKHEIVNNEMFAITAVKKYKVGNVTPV
jgi:hypothetical protein